ncbi:MAG: hypothetical protein KBG25_06880 [Paludibacteraceae bacterium]|nr:hypothetical protein [Paludibacteraceae bacterium]MBP8945602.1 hypothetical protein [Paludibacteraceae bacterium]
MKKQIELIVFYLFILATVVFFPSCSKGPSDKEIKEAITECIENDPPLSWTGGWLGGRRDVEIETIEIKQKGKFNKDEKYLPLRARVKGKCDVEEFTPGGGFEPKTVTKTFDRIANFKIYEDDYGDWEAYIDILY